MATVPEEDLTPGNFRTVAFEVNIMRHSRYDEGFTNRSIGREGDLLAENWVMIDIPELLQQMGLDLFERMRLLAQRS